MDKCFLSLLVYEMSYLQDENGIALIPGFDKALSGGKTDDAGRILRLELDMDRDTAIQASEEFAPFAMSLMEIGDWCSNSGAAFGAKPDEEFMSEAKSMDVWAKYIAGFEEFDVSRAGVRDYCRMHSITGRYPELLALMAYRFCKCSSDDSEEIAMMCAANDLARAYVINRFARKAERIDMLMDERITQSYFPERADLSVEDFKRIASYLAEDLGTNIMTRKGSLFFQMTRSDEDIEALYNELIKMDV
ncbi:MAG: hypothetical protein K5871_00200 [Lachnospiraceae bacterium]|nr:hypothetical protein [Lachnospiraceae bacterium]